MQLIDQHAKAIMEGCKERARDAGLRFGDETLEYIVTNRDMLELSPKVMIPTMYDYWVHDVEVLQGRGRYELYPSNPYETVINTRPAISFYNDNNPDWLNVMIFYHVIGHIDFFQNNLFFRHTWDDDFAGRALADKRAVARLRSEHGRWVDYVIEFARSIDNLVDFHGALSRLHRPDTNGLEPPRRLVLRRLPAGRQEGAHQRLREGDRALQRRLPRARRRRRGGLLPRDHPAPPGVRRHVRQVRPRRAPAGPGPDGVPAGAQPVPEQRREPLDEGRGAGRARDVHVLPAADPHQDHERGLGQLLARNPVHARRPHRRPRGGLRPRQRHGHLHAARGPEPVRARDAAVLLHRGGGARRAATAAPSCRCWTPTSAGISTRAPAPAATTSSGCGRT